MNTEKEKKYDRQLRLWGNHGQKSLSEASVCLLNVTPTGNEVLKNLVLPGKKWIIVMVFFLDNTSVRILKIPYKIVD